MLKMINTNLVYNFGQSIIDSSYESKKKPPKKVKTKDPEENQIIEAFEGECEQCEQEKIHKACTICKE